MNNNNLTGHYATNNENNDIVTVTDIHSNTCDDLGGYVNNNNLTGHYATNKENSDIVTVT